MVVTDLHGDRDAFDRVLARFERHRRRGEADRLILLGDVIHGYGSPDRDGSLGMVLDIMRLQRELGPDRVIMLLGNHEMPHIYGVSLVKGDLHFTPRFEHALERHRDAVLGFFRGLPFYVRTAAGVMLSHAGPSLDVVMHADLLRHFDHDAILANADDILAQSDDLDALYEQFQRLYGVPYEEMAFRDLAIRGRQDPRYPHLLRAFMIGRQSAEFRVLWNALFTQNEYGLTSQVYANGCAQFLRAFSTGAPAEQQVIASGHITTPNGQTVVNPYHLRFSSAAHARPRTAGVYLLLDCAAPVEGAHQLVPHLRPLFEM